MRCHFNSTQRPECVWSYQTITIYAWSSVVPFNQSRKRGRRMFSSSVEFAGYAKISSAREIAATSERPSQRNIPMKNSSLKNVTLLLCLCICHMPILRLAQCCCFYHLLNCLGKLQLSSEVGIRLSRNQFYLVAFASTHRLSQPVHDKVVPANVRDSIQ